MTRRDAVLSRPQGALLRFHGWWGWVRPANNAGRGRQGVSALQRQQLTALRLLSLGFMSSSTAKRMPALAQRGLVADHGRYHERDGHPTRYSVTDAGTQALAEEAT